MLIAVIPARGGSKRIPKKNVLPFFGHPMIAYTIQAARNSQLFDRIIVSTEDREIGRVAEVYGAEYLLRPEALAADDASLVEVSLHVLEELGMQRENPEALCQLMPNCPLRRSGDIIEHFEAFHRGRRSFQISVVPYRGVYPHWALRLTADGEGVWIFGEEHLVGSQELGTSWCPTGAIWWVRVADFVQQQAFYGTPLHLQPIDPNRGIDIDRRSELDLADLVVRGLRERAGHPTLEPMEAPDDEPPIGKES